jgi:hypothetical protein
MRAISISCFRGAAVLLISLFAGSAGADYVQGDWQNRDGKVYDAISFDGAGNATFRYKRREGKSGLRVTTYTYANIAASANVPNAKDIDLTFVKEEITPVLDDDVVFFNRSMKCGFDTWVLNTAMDVTSTICCPRVAAEKEYQVVKVLWSSYFFLGERDRYYDGTAVASRVRNLNLDFYVQTRRPSGEPVEEPFPPFLFNNLFQ